MRTAGVLSWVCALLLIVSCSTSPVLQTAKSVPDDVSIIKSPNDERDYRYLELDNGLKVLLISDPTADKSAASLSVFRGNFDDPAGRPGLAHFLEHMLFIGTEKYPEPDGYFNYVKSHGGSSNAYTAVEHTNYFFDIQPEAFDEGLDRFAQFFIAPLFSKEYVEREKNAVDSEYKLRLKDDGWRGFMISKVNRNPDHPVSSFNIGTLDSLSGDVHSDLVSFFESHYSADQMSLVVLARESLDELTPWVSELFSAIENRNLSNVEREAPLFAEGQLPATLRHDNIKDDHGVSYTFPVPSSKWVYRKKPARYVGNLLGHEGEGSLHKILTGKGWINLLSAGDSMIDENHGVMSINIELTPEGARHIPEITGYVFSYLDMLRGEEIEEWIYREQAKVAELGFRFAEKSSAISAVSSLSPEMEHYPPQDLLIAPYLMEEFDAGLIRDYLALLTPDNVQVTISSPGYKGEMTEKWFNVSYDLAHGGVEIASVEASALALPAPNPFLPESLELVDGDDEKPLPVIKLPEADIYLDSDVEFGVPRAVTHVSLRNEGGLIALEDVAAARLYTALVQDDLNALAYPALLAGVSYQIAAPPKGFRVSIGGYYDKQLVLMDEVLTRLTGLDISPDRFTVLKEDMLRELQNARKENPYQQVYGRLQDELLDARWTPEQMTPAVASLTRESLMAWRDRTLSAVSVESLLLGNVNQQRADDLFKLLKQRLNVFAVEVTSPVVAEVEGANTLGIEIDHDDASMVVFVQDEGSSFEDRAKSALLVHIVSPKYFSSLRTEQQLGYVVFTVNTRLRERAGVSFIVQSPVVGPDELRRRTLAFIETQVQRLAEMSEEEFGANKGGLITSLTQRDRNLAQRAGRYWADLDQGIVTFDSRHQVAAAVSELSLDDIRVFLGDVQAKLGNQYVYVYSEGKFSAE
jgi:secreted Zn-dependent insulinase-like peptidase